MDKREVREDKREKKAEAARLRRRDSGEWTLDRCARMLEGNPDGCTVLLAVVLGGGGKVRPGWSEEEKKRIAGKLGAG